MRSRLPNGRDVGRANADRKLLEGTAKFLADAGLAKTTVTVEDWLVPED
jgi:hypothetical protein